MRGSERCILPISPITARLEKVCSRLGRTLYDSKNASRAEWRLDGHLGHRLVVLPLIHQECVLSHASASTSSVHRGTLRRPEARSLSCTPLSLLQGRGPAIRRTFFAVCTLYANANFFLGRGMIAAFLMSNTSFCALSVSMLDTYGNILVQQTPAQSAFKKPRNGKDSKRVLCYPRLCFSRGGERDLVDVPLSSEPRK